jgi:hypothetical protein
MVIKISPKAAEPQTSPWEGRRGRPENRDEVDLTYRHQRAKTYIEKRPRRSRQAQI